MHTPKNLWYLPNKDTNITICKKQQSDNSGEIKDDISMVITCNGLAVPLSS